MAEPTRFDLSPHDIPTAWFNILPDMVGAVIQPLPPLHPGTKEPITPDLLAPLFPEALILQEISTEQWIDLPGPVLDIYRLWRPTPLHRAVRLEQALQTPARTYFKYEGGSPAGSHKPNTAVAQAFYNKESGVRRISTETGAGQWGSALSMACRFFGLECLVFMVKASYEQKPYRQIFMETFGAEVRPSPSSTTQKGKFAYDFGDTGQMTPLLPMYTLGHDFVPAPVHAGGLRYHGDAPSLSLLVREGHMEAAAYTQNEVFDAAVQFAHTQGIIPAPESAHAIRGAINEAVEAREAGQEKVILIGLSGHGHFDMQAYDDYLNARLPEVEFDPSAEEAALARLPEVPIAG